MATLGGAIASASLFWLYGRDDSTEASVITTEGSAGPCCEYVNYRGWIVTPEDRDTLTAGDLGSKVNSSTP